MGSLLSWTPVYSGGHRRIGRLNCSFSLSTSHRLAELSEAQLQAV